MGIINNVHINGIGQDVYDGSVKTGMDLRGFIMASNLYIYDLKRAAAESVVGIRVNADTQTDAAGPGYDALRYGGAPRRYPMRG
jgi:hypothetical protein